MNHWEATASPSHLPAPGFARGPSAWESCRQGSTERGRCRGRRHRQAHASFPPTRELVGTNTSKPRANASVQRAGLASAPSLRSRRSATFGYPRRVSSRRNALPGQRRSRAEIHRPPSPSRGRRTPMTRSPGVVFPSCLQPKKTCVPRLRLSQTPAPWSRRQVARDEGWRRDAGGPGAGRVLFGYALLRSRQLSAAPREPALIAIVSLKPERFQVKKPRRKHLARTSHSFRSYGSRTGAKRNGRNPRSATCSEPSVVNNRPLHEGISGRPRPPG